jgi:hypothetical protein
MSRSLNCGSGFPATNREKDLPPTATELSLRWRFRK